MIDLATLEQFGENAQVWARAYTRTVEALMREGVPQPIARREARWITAVAVLGGMEEDMWCPQCGEPDIEDVTTHESTAWKFVCGDCGFAWEVPSPEGGW